MTTALIILGVLALAFILGGAAIVGSPGAGALMDERKIPAVNRTGGATVVGGVYALDVAQSDGASTSIELGASNVIAVATARFKSPLVVALQVLADDQEGTFMLQSPDVPILIEGTTDVAAGESLVPVNAQTYLKNQSTNTLAGAIAFAWAAQTSATPTLTRCYFNGLAAVGSTNPAS